MSEVTSNVKMFALIAAIIGLLGVIFSFTFGFYPFYTLDETNVEIQTNLFGNGEITLFGTTADLETSDWADMGLGDYPSAAAWIAWVGLLIVLIAGVVYYLIKSEMITLEGQDTTLALGIMVGGVITLLGMIWWMIGMLDLEDVEMEDLGYGLWVHILFGMSAVVLGYLIWTEEK